MANVNCKSCNDLQEYAPDFVTNGVTETVCTSLQNNTGMNPKNTRDNCDDVTDANDCLVGQFSQTVGAYDNCDWKDFVRNLGANIHNVLSAVICWLCGVQKKIDKLECQIKALSNGVTFYVGEKESDGSYVVAGKGCSFLIPLGERQGSADVYVNYIAGGMVRLGGSYQFFRQDFTDKSACINFDNGGTTSTSASRKGNSIWGTNPPNLVYGGELIGEIRIKKSAFPQLKSLQGGFGQETGGGSYHSRSVVFDGDSKNPYAFGQHGACDTETGEPWATGMDKGHRVPAGWIYIQVRMSSIFNPLGNNTQYSPQIIMSGRMNLDGFEC